jgi:NSS family neurotransmitter:Na+ symporter
MARLAMPVVFGILGVLAVYALTLPGWDRAASFLFTPDVSVLDDPTLWSAAFGQVFFSLAVGQGVMLTYGSYVDDGTDLLRSSLLVTVADIGAALLAGLVIFSIVFSFGLEPTLGTELAFRTLPAAFGTMPFGRVVAVAFFGLLFLAALSSAVSLLEVGVAAATNTTRLTRPRATRYLTAGVFGLGIPSALSYSPLRLAVAGRPVLDLVDASVGTYALPVSALLITFVFVWATELDGVRTALGRLYPLVRYVTPAVLLVVTLAKALGVAVPAWRMLLEAERTGSVGFLVAVGLLTTLAGSGWVFRDRIRRSPRRRS